MKAIALYPFNVGVCQDNSNKRYLIRRTLLVSSKIIRSMTEENNPDDIEENSEGENWNPLTQTREWSAAATELVCFALARMKDKDLVEIY